VACAVDDCVVDAARKIVTTPAYMYPARISEAHRGISKLVTAVLEMA
jgi:enhancing lycopene biosynthesis protein 2